MKYQVKFAIKLFLLLLPVPFLAAGVVYILISNTSLLNWGSGWGKLSFLIMAVVLFFWYMAVVYNVILKELHD